MKTKATMIFPEDAHELVKVQHFLFSLDRPAIVDYVRVDGETKLPVVITELSFMEKIMLKVGMKFKLERVTIFG